MCNFFQSFTTADESKVLVLKSLNEVDLVKMLVRDGAETDSQELFNAELIRMQDNPGFSTFVTSSSSITVELETIRWRSVDRQVFFQLISIDRGDELAFTVEMFHSHEC